jgi:methyl-accepting chemotaxis protein
LLTAGALSYFDRCQNALLRPRGIGGLSRPLQDAAKQRLLVRFTIVSALFGAGAASAALLVDRAHSGFLIAGVVILASPVAMMLYRLALGPFREVASDLHSITGELAETAHEEQARVSEVSAAVAETVRSMERILDAARTISVRANEVLHNAEQTMQESYKVVDHIVDLSELSTEVADVLGRIASIADRTDLLALNASLEAVRAQTAGKGFALVASEMRRLAGSVTDAVSEIRALLDRIRAASETVAVASNDGALSSDKTTTSAREIAEITDNQRYATEEVLRTMQHLADVICQAQSELGKSVAVGKMVSAQARKMAALVNGHRRRPPSVDAISESTGAET